MRKMILSVIVVAFFTAACGGNSDGRTAQSAPAPATVPATPSATPSATVPATPSFAPLRAKDFSLVGYVPTGTPGEWRPDGANGMPILIANATQVTAFRYGGFTCKLTRRDEQLTPSFAQLMFVTAARDGLREGKSDFTLPRQGGGRFRAGRIFCKKV